MAGGKTYKYTVQIGVTTNTKGLKEGGDSVSREMTRWEKQAQRAIAQFEKLSKAIAIAQKANNSANQRVRSGGIDTQMLKALADIARMQRQQERAEKDLTRTMEREAKAQAITKAREMRRAADEMIRQIDRVNKAESVQYSARRSLSADGVFGGSFLGTLAGTGVSSVLGSIISKTKELGIEAIKVGANFEQTANAIRASAGSITLAREQLKELETLARNTNGLGLETAEKGFLRLRSVGFEAELAKDFLEGLSKVKILSGGTQDDLEAVIYNFTQVRAQGKLTGDELKESLGRLPALAPIIQKAFGTIDTKKIAALGLTSEEFFDRLNKGLKDTKGAAGGANDAWEKFTDELTIAMREVSAPILPDLTRDLKTLTASLRENGNQWGELGTIISNFYNALKTDNPRDLIDALFSSPEEGTRIKRARELKALTFDQYVKEQTGQTVAQIEKYKQSLNGILSGAEPTMEAKRKLMNLRIGYNTFLNEKEFEVLRPEREGAATKAEQEAINATQTATNRARSLELGRLESYYSEIASIRESAFRISESQNENDLSKLLEIRQLNFAAEIKETVAFYNRKLALTDGSQEEIYKTQIEAANKIRTIQTNAQLEELKIQKQINQQKRQDYLSFKNLQEREVSASFDKQFFDLERAINRETVISSDGYDKLIELTQNKFNIISQITREQYQTRLQDESLNAQQRVNLEKEMNLALEDLAEQNRRRLLEIDEARYNTQLEKLKQFADRQQSLIDSRVSVLSRFNPFFDPNNFSSANAQLFNQTYLDSSNLQKELDASKTKLDKAAEKLKVLEDEYNSKYRAPDGRVSADESAIVGLEDTRKEFENTSKDIEIAVRHLNLFESGITSTEKEVSKLGETLTNTKNSFKIFDEISEKILLERQSKERKSLDIQRGFAGQELNIAIQQRADNRAYFLNDEIPRLQGLKDRTPQEEKSLKDLVEESQLSKDNYEKWKNLVAEKLPTKEILDARLRVQLLDDAFKNLTSEQAQQRLEEYRNSFKGLAEETEKILNGDIPTMNALDAIFNKQRAEDAKGLAIEIRALENEIKNFGANDNLKIQKAYLEDVINLRNRETDAIIATNSALLELSQKGNFSAVQANAEFLDFLNQNTKTLSSIYASAEISAVTSFWDAMDKSISKVTDKLGAFGDILKQVLLDLIKLATSKFFANSQSGNGGGIFNTIKNVVTGGQSSNNGNLFTNGTTAANFGGNRTIANALGSNPQNEFGANIPSLTSNTTPTPLGGAMQALQSQLPASLTSGVARGVTGQPRGKFGDLKAEFAGDLAGAGISPLLKLGKFGKLAGSIAPMLGMSLGGMLGGSSTAGGIFGQAGGLAAGLALAISTGAIGQGATAGFSLLGGVLSAGAATGILAAIAGPLLVGAWLFGRNKQRRADEKTRNTAMVDAFAALDKLITDVGADKIDGASALSQADDIRKNYVDSMRQLKSDKTRRIAMADVSRIDAKISALKSAVKAQDQRKEKMAMLTPTFADGGSVSNFARKNYRNNPLGYIQGPGTSRSDSIHAWFPKAASFANISNREYVLDAETTKNVGINNLDNLRAGKGKNFGDMMRRMNRVHEPRIQLADGGAVGISGTNGGGGETSGSASASQKVHVVNNIYQQSDGSVRVETDVYLDTPQGKQKIEKIVEEKIYQNGKTGAIPVALNRNS